LTGKTRLLQILLPLAHLRLFKRSGYFRDAFRRTTTLPRLDPPLPLPAPLLSQHRSTNQEPPSAQFGTAVTDASQTYGFFILFLFILLFVFIF